MTEKERENPTHPFKEEHEMSMLVRLSTKETIQEVLLTFLVVEKGRDSFERKTVLAGIANPHFSTC
jgi:hypothetical protein